MTRLLFLLPGLLIWQACDLGQTPMVTPEFALFDTTGRHTSQFHAGEDFVMKFDLVNHTGKDLTYYYTEPPVIFEILLGDSILSSSIDGLAFPQNVNSGTVRQGALFEMSWRAPNSIARNPHIMLTPGAYLARVRHESLFYNFYLVQTDPIPFTVAQ